MHHCTPVFSKYGLKESWWNWNSSIHTKFQLSSLTNKKVSENVHFVHTLCAPVHPCTVQVALHDLAQVVPLPSGAHNPIWRKIPSQGLKLRFGYPPNSKSKHCAAYIYTSFCLGKNYIKNGRQWTMSILSNNARYLKLYPLSSKNWKFYKYSFYDNVLFFK